MKKHEQPATPLDRCRDFLYRHKHDAAIVAGSVTISTLVFVGADALLNKDGDARDGDRCGVGVVDATGGTAWNTSGEAAQDAGVEHPDMISASGMLADKAEEQPYGLQPGQAYKICFDGDNPVLVETTTHPLLEPTASTTPQS